jgi:hypothetical protein
VETLKKVNQPKIEITSLLLIGVGKFIFQHRRTAAGEYYLYVDRRRLLSPCDAEERNFSGWRKNSASFSPYTFIVIIIMYLI